MRRDGREGKEKSSLFFSDNYSTINNTSPETPTGYARKEENEKRKRVELFLFLASSRVSAHSDHHHCSSRDMKEKRVKTVRILAPFSDANRSSQLSVSN